LKFNCCEWTWGASLQSMLFFCWSEIQDGCHCKNGHLIIPYKVGNFNVDRKSKMGSWCHFQQYFSYIVGLALLEENRVSRKNYWPANSRQQMSWTCIEYTLQCSGIKLTKLIVTNNIDRCTFVFPTNISSWPKQK